MQPLLRQRQMLRQRQVREGTNFSFIGGRVTTYTRSDNKITVIELPRLT